MSKHQELPLELQSESGIWKWCSPFVCKWILSSLCSSHHTTPPPTPHFSPPPPQAGQGQNTASFHSPLPGISPHSTTQVLVHNVTSPSGALEPLNMQKPTLCATDHTWAPRSTEGRDTSSPSHLPQGSHMPRREKEKPLATMQSDFTSPQ